MHILSMAFGLLVMTVGLRRRSLGDALQSRAYLDRRRKGLLPASHSRLGRNQQAIGAKKQDKKPKRPAIRAMTKTLLDLIATFGVWLAPPEPPRRLSARERDEHAERPAAWPAITPLAATIKSLRRPN